ncbi:MAG: low molecular weight protein-tyrosine-phosphatase [Cellvibrio sp.]|jgi:protein-tyrosine phosphatase
MNTKVLFVCLGNICRSPTAEGIFRKVVTDARMHDQIIIDSAGTGGWHIGKAPDSRTVSAAKKRGYDLSNLRARQVNVSDFDEFDFILAMDNANLRDLKAMAPGHYQGHLGLFLDFAGNAQHREVPDPYYGEAEGFDLVLDLVEDASAGLLSQLQQRRRA